jgi:hypothetical protein
MAPPLTQRYEFCIGIAQDGIVAERQQSPQENSDLVLPHETKQV